MSNIIDSKPSMQCKTGWRPRIIEFVSYTQSGRTTTSERYHFKMMSSEEITAFLKDGSDEVKYKGYFYFCGLTGRIFMYAEKDSIVIRHHFEPIEVFYSPKRKCDFKDSCLNFACPFCTTTPASFCAFWNKKELGHTLYISDLPPDFGEKPFPLNQMLDFNNLWADVPPRDGTAVDGHEIATLWGDKN